MTTAQIVSFADPGSLASPDLSLDVTLRRKVIPFFLGPEDPLDSLGGGVGYPEWRRKTALQNINQGDTSFPIPLVNGLSDFWKMIFIGIGLQITASMNMDFERDELTYIGDRPALVARALQATAQERPTGYFFGGTPEAPTVQFSGPADQVYVCRYAYYTRIVFTDDTTSVDLSQYIPEQHQWTLVELLRRELYGFRFGVGDNRFSLADAESRRFLQAARTSPEQTEKGKRPRFAR